MSKARRNLAIDSYKGLLTLLMVYCHVLQFFGDSALSPANETWMQLANLLVFPGFLFALGQNIQQSYYGRSFMIAAPRMLQGALRLYGAFVISGCGYRLLRDGRPLSSKLVQRVMLLTDIPGWSEFIIALALFMLLGLLLHPLMRRWSGPLVPAIPGLLCLLTAFIDYSAISDTRLQLLLGGHGFACFPVMQYAVYFFLGMAYARAKDGLKQYAGFAALALVMSLLGLWRALALHQMPNRFPPDIGWLLLPALPLALLTALAQALEHARLQLTLGKGVKLRLSPPLAPLRSLGRSSMAYLLLSNLTLFTMAGKGIAPVLNLRSALFSHTIKSAGGAFIWTMVLLILIALILSFASKWRSQPDEAWLVRERAE